MVTDFLSSTTTTMEEQKKRSPLFMYLFFVLLRLIWTLFGRSYVYPDEFFQSPEVMARDVFGMKTWIPWEFANTTNPCRSITPAAITSGLAFLLLGIVDALLKALSLSFNVITPQTLFLLPRIQMFLYSFCLDGVLFAISRSCKLEWESLLIPLSSSWTILVFHTRTFLNSTEAILLALALYQHLKLMSSHSISKLWKECIILGVVLSLGIFSRFTFAIFYAPLGLILLYNTYQTLSHSASVIIRLSCVFSSTLLPIFLGFFITSFVQILVDSFYFSSSSHKTEEGEEAFRFIFTPLNSFLYNLKSENLEQHGLHPSWTHSLVNASIMFGPLYFVTIYQLLITVFPSSSSSRPTFPSSSPPSSSTTPIFSSISTLSSRHPPSPSSSTSPSPSPSTYLKKNRKEPKLSTTLYRASLGVIFFSLFTLSLAPHQEPRFLLPLLLPFLLVSSRIIWAKIWLFRIWLLFNLLLAFFFGFIHQGGVIPAIFEVNLQSKLEEADLSRVMDVFVFFHTYMPPNHLFLLKEEVVIDLAGCSTETLVSEIAQLLKETKTKLRVWIIAPETVKLEEEVSSSTSSSWKLKKHKSFWPHFSGEDFPSGKQIMEKSWNCFTLNVWLLERN